MMESIKTGFGLYIKFALIEAKYKMAILCLPIVSAEIIQRSIQLNNISAEEYKISYSYLPMMYCVTIYYIPRTKHRASDKTTVYYHTLHYG